MTNDEKRAHAEELSKINDLLLDAVGSGSDGAGTETKLDLICYGVAALLRLESDQLSAEVGPDEADQTDLFPDLPPPCPDVTES